MLLNPQLKPFIDRLQSEKAAFIQQIESLTAEERGQFPESGWNMLQVMEHVITSEQGTFGYLEKKTQAPYSEIPLTDETMQQNGEKLKDALLSDNRWKAPQVLPDPTGAQSFENMSTYWDNLRSQYFKFLEDLDEQYYKRQVFKHPFSGRLNLFQTLEFQINHIVHHGYQIDRIKAEISD